MLRRIRVEQQRESIVNILCSNQNCRYTKEDNFRIKFAYWDYNNMIDSLTIRNSIGFYVRYAFSIKWYKTLYKTANNFFRVR